MPEMVFDQCLNCKIKYYYVFLITKIELQAIKHRKIVHKLLLKYLPNKKRLLLYCNEIMNENN